MVAGESSVERCPPDDLWGILDEQTRREVLRAPVFACKVVGSAVRSGNLWAEKIPNSLTSEEDFLISMWLSRQLLGGLTRSGGGVEG
jgi:hypothetical protein